ncbi:MAG: Rieske (2Fe-2S) protein [Planctomycetes bacterium]|nr:Rieske (2Fe-2S) protein [Planctomycetota bacterium]
MSADAEAPKDEKPAAADRRSFLDLLIRGGLLAGAGAMAAPTVAYLWPARAGGGKTAKVSAGPVKDFPVGSARMVQAEGKPIIVIRAAEDRFRAFSAICTHLGCVVKWDSGSGKIRCPCHAGVFGTDGKQVSGPPPRALSEYEVSIVGGEVVVTL